MTNVRMLMIAPAPAVREGGKIILDGKFAQGMSFQARSFPGSFDCILRESDASLQFYKKTYVPEEDGFGLAVLGQSEAVETSHLEGYDLIFCSMDDERNFGIPEKAKAVGAKLATTLEYTLATRLAINAVDPNKSWVKKLYGSLKLRRQEILLRRNLHLMDGIQSNGYPAYEVCRKFDPDTLLFLDNRMTPEMFASEAERVDRRQRLESGAPLRIVFSGRLEPMKGAHQLVPIAAMLRDRSVPFTLDIFGAGSLEAQIGPEIARHNLGGVVALRGAVDFASELVPEFRRNADIFLSCHLQDDPSCSFIEAMACGLSVAGYDNLMWRGLADASHGGWISRLGDRAAMADCLARLHKKRTEVADRCEDALAFARQHDFETMSRRRMEHLASIAMR